jgi:hypothetical protein
MFKIIRTAALSAVIGIGAIAAMPASAEAASASFSFGISSGNGAVSVQFGPGHRYQRGHGRYYHRRHCTDGQALSKARQMGLRNARVVRASHRNVEIRGWSRWRGHSAIVFSRAPHCPIVARY